MKSTAVVTFTICILLPISLSQTGVTPVMEEELGMSGAAADDLEAELVRRVMEEEVGGGAGMLMQFEPLVVAVVTNPSRCVRCT